MNLVSKLQTRNRHGTMNLRSTTTALHILHTVGYILYAVHIYVLCWTCNFSWIIHFGNMKLYISSCMLYIFMFYVGLVTFHGQYTLEIWNYIKLLSLYSDREPVGKIRLQPQPVLLQFSCCILNVYCIHSLTLSCVTHLATRSECCLPLYCAVKPLHMPVDYF